jgi:polyribonucleotide nucleotidyltransferase
MVYRKELEIGGTTLTIEMGRLAKQADGAALVRLGDTMVLVTACAAKTEREGLDFLPLTVDYRENFYAAGKIPGGFFKREGRPSEKEILTSRLIDRPIRPLFPGAWHCETQVVGLVLSSDKENDPDTIAITGASAALYCSDIPFTTPIAAVRVGLLEDGFVINPKFEELKTSRLNLTVAGSREAIVMVEAGAKAVTEAEMIEALAKGHDAIRKLIDVQEELYREIRPTKREVPEPTRNEEVYRSVEAAVSAPLLEAMRLPGKLESQKKIDDLIAQHLDGYSEDESEDRSMAKKAIAALKEKHLRTEVLQNKKRLDGRRFDEIRTITCEVGVLPRTHGSSVFTRGETQALVTVTLGTSEDVQKLDWLEGVSQRRFMLHYNFPPFSVGEVKFLRGPGRREIGHGALAERALAPVIPLDDQFPYTVRIVSDILESNGSSSMASVTGGCLALMDAGVPVKAPVAGIAMGLVKEGDNYAILTDIAGAEDHYGDMDFKVAGTKTGITALQMDIKISGVTPAIMAEALEQARQGRLFILEKMAETIDSPRQNISSYAPRIFTMRIPTAKIRDVIGPGGKMIRSIVERTQVKIDVEDDGTVSIASSDEESARKAMQIIEELTAVAEMGKTYLGKVQRIVDFGAFVEILPGTDGLVHISEIADYRVKDVKSELAEGDQVLVKVINIDPQGKVKLSRKAVLREQAGLPPEEPQQPRSSDGGRRGDRDRHGRGRRPGRGGGEREGRGEREERGEH